MYSLLYKSNDPQKLNVVPQDGKVLPMKNPSKATVKNTKRTYKHKMKKFTKCMVSNEFALEMNCSWKQMVQNVCLNFNNKQILSTISNIDLHGACVTIVQSSQNLGLKGIIIRDSPSFFELFLPSCQKTKKIYKKGNNFVIEIKKDMFYLLSGQALTKKSDKKFKKARHGLFKIAQ